MLLVDGRPAKLPIAGTVVRVTLAGAQNSTGAGDRCPFQRRREWRRGLGIKIEACSAA